MPKGEDAENLRFRQFSRRYYAQERTITAAKASDERRSGLDGKTVISAFKEKVLSELEQRSVEKVSQEENVLFIHGIHLLEPAMEYTLLKPDVDWETKLGILLALRPTIAASTIYKEDGPERLWFSLGVILSRGTILKAFPQDSGTISTAINQRGHSEEPPIDTTFAETVKNAIRNRTKDPNPNGNLCNELVVENPQIAGLYICLDKSELEKDGYLTTKLIDKALQAADKFGLKIFYIEKGEWSEATVDSEERILRLKKKVGVEDIIKHAYALPKEKRDEIISSIIVNSPFNVCLLSEQENRERKNNLAIPDIYYILSRFAGRKFFVERNRYSENLKASAGKTIEVDTNIVKSLAPGNLDSSLRLGDILEEIANIEGPESNVTYYRLERDRKILFQQTKRREPLGGPELWLHAPIGINVDKYQKTINLGFGSIQFDKTISEDQNYFAEMDKKIKEIKYSLERLFPQLSPEQVAEFRRNMTILACHLYGFGEQAGIHGDIKKQEQAFAMASQALTYEEYQEILRRRVGPNGQFLLVKEELLPVV